MRILDPAGRGAQQFRNTSGSIPASGLKQVAGDYKIGDADATVICSTMRGGMTITLPRPALNAGRTVTIRKDDAGSGSVKIRSVNGEPVGGASWVTLTAANEYVTLQSDGAVWMVVAHF